MTLQNRKFCIIMDNAESHDIYDELKKFIDGFKFFLLFHITILLLSPNVTSIIHPLDQGAIAAFKMYFKRKLVAWTTQQIDNLDENLEKLNVDLFQSMLWFVVAWHELNDQTIKNCWTKSAILPTEWNADINISDESMKSKIEEAALELGNLIAALNLDLYVEGKLIEKFSPLEYINMEVEDEFEMEYSTEELMQSVQDGEEILDSMEENSMIVDSNDDEYKGVKLSEAHVYAKDILNFMASQGSKIFNTQELSTLR